MNPVNKTGSQKTVFSYEWNNLKSVFSSYLTDLSSLNEVDGDSQEEAL